MTYNYKRIRLNKNITRDEHRLVMEKYLGRTLTSKEIIHHINGNTKDNRIENLEITNRAKHAKEHYDGGDMPKISTPIKKIEIEKNKFKCNKCSQIKHIDDFLHNKNKAFGIDGICKKCFNDMRRGHYKYRPRHKLSE